MVSKQIAFSNVSLDKNKAYILYIGEFKHHKLCDFYIKPMRKYYGKAVEIIYIFKNYPPTYFDGSYILINPGLIEAMKKFKRPCFAKIYLKNVNELASNSPYIINLVKKILNNQKDLYISAFKDTPELTLHRKLSNVKLIGPKTKFFDFFDQKIDQREIIEVLGIPQPSWYLAPNRDDLLKLFSNHFKNKKAFVSHLHSHGGHGSFIINSRTQLLDHPNLKKQNRKYLISELINTKLSLAGEAIVANEKEVFFTAVTDQIMKNASFLGAIYPSKASPEIQKQIEKYVVKIGKYMGKHGYRGFVGVDFVVDTKDNLYFVEINPRLCGGTLARSYMHEVSKKKGFSSLPELGLKAVMKNTYGKTASKKTRNTNFSWGLLNVYAPIETITSEEFLPGCSAAEAFKEMKTTILDFRSKGTYYFEGGDLCRILSVKKSRAEVERELSKKKALVLKTLKQNYSPK